MEKFGETRLFSQIWRIVCIPKKPLPRIIEKILITGVFTLILFVYLILALLKPEWFG